MSVVLKSVVPGQARSGSPVPTLGPTPDPVNQTHWWWGPIMFVLTSRLQEPPMHAHV